MANPIAIAAALAGYVKVTCPHCGNRMAVKKGQAKERHCSRCKKTFTTEK